jgi:hypothetical protein
MGILILTCNYAITEEKRKEVEKSISESIREYGVVILDKRFNTYEIIDLKKTRRKQPL